MTQAETGICRQYAHHRSYWVQDASEDGSESDGSAASSPRSPIVPAAAMAVPLPASSQRRGSALIPKLDVVEAPREGSSRPADGEEWQAQNAESGSGAGSGPPSQRQGWRALSAMEGATVAVGKMQAVQRPAQDMGASLFSWDSSWIFCCDFMGPG